MRNCHNFASSALQGLTISDVCRIIPINMIKFFIIFCLIFSHQTGNSATFTDEIWANERLKYLKLCIEHKEKLKVALLKDDNLYFELRSPATALSSLCKREPKLCDPPRKPESLLFYEQMGKPYTQDFCLDI